MTEATATTAMPARAVTVSQASAPAAPAAPAQLRPDDRIDDVYRVERLLGEGGGGAVYLVHHDGLRGARFALKVLHDTTGRADALAREGRLAAEVASPHVVKVAALGRLPDGAHYLVMEYVEGPTLDALLADRDLATDAAVDVVSQLCLALEAAHARGLVHGDVSLRNVFATARPDGGLHVQLGDFGLARRVRREGAVTVSAEQRSGLGTPRFASPEALSGDAIDERSDVFSAGVILYRLLVGRVPFDGPSLREVVSATVRGDAAPLVAARPALHAFDPLVRRCLAPDPTARYPSARALREALREALCAGPPPAAALPPLPPLASPRRAALALVALACAAATSWAALDRWRARAAVPIGASLRCPDTELPGAARDVTLARALALGLCARVGAALDLDWLGGPDATVITSRLTREGDGTLRLTLTSRGRVVTARGATPLDALRAGARRVVARADLPPMPPDEVRRWGARDPSTAAAVRSLWRRRTSLLLADYESEPRALLARDPTLPLVHLLLLEVDHDPTRRREAAAAALAHAHRLPAARAEALRALVTIRTGEGDREDALERLRRAYNAAPDDVDVGVLYTSALVESHQREVACGVAQRVYARAPGRAALALHLLGYLPERSPGEMGRLQAPLGEALPETRGGSSNICSLVDQGRLAEADVALAFARRLGLSAEALAIPAAVAALAHGDPAQIDRATAIQQGMAQTWSQVTGARLRVAGLLHRGRVAEADAALEALIRARRSAGDLTEAVSFATRRLQLARAVGAPVDRALVAWVEATLPRVTQKDEAFLLTRLELALTRTSAEARGELAALDAEVARRARGDVLRRAGLSLRLVPLAAFARGDRDAADRWRAGASSWLGHRAAAAYSAARALEAVGDAGGAEAAYRLAMSPYELYERPFEVAAARLRLAELLAARGATDEARALRSDLDRIWSEADEGLVARLRGLDGVAPAP